MPAANQLSEIKDEIEVNGFSIVEQLFNSSEVQKMISLIEPAFAEMVSNQDESSIRSKQGNVYAVRNLHELIEDFDRIWNDEQVCHVISSVYDN